MNRVIAYIDGFNRRSHQLTQAAHGHFIINETTFRRCQLPQQVQRADGHVLSRP